MNYRLDRYGNRLSVLGYGCMRFPRTRGKIDMKATERQLMAAFEQGVNYFDTAYIYPGSEAALGEILEKNHIRDQVFIATKLPHYLIKNKESLEQLFAEQCKRLRTDHIDFYFMHMLTDTATWNRLKELGIEEWIREKKASGAIRQVGFSYHGNSEMFCSLVDAYDWDFTMIQYNYMDEHTQAGRRGLVHAHQKGLSVMIMEPLRGGKLATGLPNTAMKTIEEYPVKRTPAQWAFRWLWDQPEVTVVLSGMNSDEMVRDNIQTACDTEIGSFSREDQMLLQKVAEAINAKMKVRCTGCGYCVPCPQKVDIPGAFAAYNRRFSEGKFRGFKEYFMCTALRSEGTAASNCISCGKCTKHCPQAIDIPAELKAVQKELEGPVYRIAKKAAKWFVRF